MSRKILTVSIAAYNVERYLEEALKPFILSKYKEDLEVLIIDDGSKDSTSEIAKKYQNQFPDTFRLISKVNGGWGSTLNVGMREGTGKYFKQLDGDDYFSYENLDDFIDFLRKTDADFIHSPYVTFTDKNGAILKVHSNRSDVPWRQTVAIEEMPVFFPYMHTTTIKLSLLKNNKVQITEKCFYTDNEFVVKSLSCCNTIAFYELPVYYYRLARSGQSMSIESLRKNWRDHQKMLFCVLEHERSHPLSNNVKIIIEDRLRQICSFQYVLFFILPDSQENKNSLVEFDLKLKENFPYYYLNERNNAVKLLRKTGFWGWNLVGKIQTYRDKTKKINVFAGA